MLTFSHDELFPDLFRGNVYRIVSKRFIIIIIIIIIMSEYFCRITVSVLYKYIQVKKLLSTLALRKALK